MIISIILLAANVNFCQAWVPTWAFGRSFKGGNSSNNIPEQNLGSLMGLVSAMR
jgi:hypothetical protein